MKTNKEMKILAPLDEYNETREGQIIRRVIEHEIPHFKRLRENEVPSLAKQKSVLNGEFVELSKLKEFYYAVPREVYNDIASKLTKKFRIDFYEEEIEKLEKARDEMMHNLSQVPLKIALAVAITIYLMTLIF